MPHWEAYCLLDFWQGGGVRIDGGSTTFTACNIYGNTATNELGAYMYGNGGGGVFASNSDVTFNDCHIYGNSAFHVYEGHGGPDMALLAYPHEHYQHWRAIDIALPPAGAMAENITTSGLLEHDVHIGDVFTLGTATVQVCETRSPCFKIAARYGRPDLAVAVQATGRTGYLLRVLEPGDVAAGDPMTLIGRDDHGLTVAEAGRIMNVDRHDLDGARRLLAVDALGASARRMLQTRLRTDPTALRGLHTERLFGDEDDTNST